MLEKNSFKKNLAITQGRHLEKINNKIQIFPEKNWTKELKLFKQTKLNYIEWVISADNFDKNPICQINGHKIIKKYLKKYKIKCRSVDLDFVVKENPLKFSEKKLNIFLKKIQTIAFNSKQINIKYLIFPFLEKSSPNSKIKINKIIDIFKKVKKSIPSKLFILLETDIKPENLIILIKRLKKKVFINYDIGNSASKNYEFDKEKKYFKYVKNIHLKDRIKNGSTIRFGNGNANFKELFQFLHKNKSKYNFTLQPARSKCDKDIKEIKLNINYLDQLLLKL